MNNEFNNQGMNQFQSNNNFNNGYVNNQNNKNDNWKNVLIGVMAVIILGLTALTIYVVVDKKDNNVDNSGNNNNIQENENNDNSNIEDNNEKDYAAIEKKVLDEYYLKTTDIIDEHVLGYEYSMIANGKIGYEDFRKNYIMGNIIDSLEPISNVGCSDKNTVNHVKDEYDKNGVKYPDYCGDYANSCVENIAKDFGLTVEEISKMDKNVWGVSHGWYCFYMYDAKEVKEKYLDIYNEMFVTSFSGGGEMLSYGYHFDKNLNKIITSGYSGTSGGNSRAIIDSKEENNLYKVKFAEGYFEHDFDENGSNGKYVLVIDSETNNNISGITDPKQAVKDNKDKLPNYEVTFEKVSTGYKFKEIKKVS